MSQRPDWLPDLVRLQDYHTDWAQYLEALYCCFKADFIDSRPTFRGIRLGMKRQPMREGKEATFWHMITSGSHENSRSPDQQRCERIRWPRAIIDHSDDPKLRTWENTRSGETRICIYLEAEKYLVVLARRKSYLLPWTAYLVTHKHREKALMREWEEYQKG